jgi:regulator of replication initiation timing
MSDEVVMSELEVDSYKEPVPIEESDHEQVNEIKTLSDTLVKYRQEMGRLLQLIGNIRDEANRLELEVANKRRTLSQKYSLETYGNCQWALDFEKKEFVKTVNGSPVIP